jgi:hypothetical protein
MDSWVLWISLTTDSVVMKVLQSSLYPIAGRLSLSKVSCMHVCVFV